MKELADSALLRKYVELDSEEAFAALVTRHVNKVYSVALRHTRNLHQAEEITQAVFVILARKAPQLDKGVILEGWLYQTARLTAVTFMRSEIRRARREQEAHMQSVLNENESEVWAQISPLLDAAMARLNEADRHAIVLRFIYGKSMKEIGAVLGGSESAAKMRVNRAVEKMRGFFTKRGVVLPAAVLTAAISANSVQAAPVVLAKTATAVALAKGATASASTLTLIKGALKVMAWTKMKTAIAVGVGVLLAAGSATVAVKEVAAHRHEVWQEKYDLSVLDTVPPQARILSTLASTLQSHLHAMGGRNGKVLGLGQSVPDLLMTAYGVNSGQLIFATPIPEGKYDFISTLPGNPREVLQQEIQKKFGLVGRRGMIETNVLILTVQTHDAAGLRPAAGQFSGDQEPDSYSAHGQSIYPLVDYLERVLGIVVVDQTKLAETFDIDFKWDSTPEGLKRVLLDELGLKLSSSRQSIEFLVVEKTN